MNEVWNEEAGYYKKRDILLGLSELQTITIRMFLLKI